MKTEDLKALGLNDEQVQRVFAMNGADVNREKQAAETAKAERDAIRTQLDEANTKLKGYDPDWQQKATDAQKAADAKWPSCRQAMPPRMQPPGCTLPAPAPKRHLWPTWPPRTCPCRGTACWALTTL